MLFLVMPLLKQLKNYLPRGSSNPFLSDDYGVIEPAPNWSDSTYRISHFSKHIYYDGLEPPIIEDCIVIGNQTAGADGDVAVFEYIGGYRTAISGNGILYPNGTETQRKGVRIDIEVKPTINGLKNGRDEVLEKAIEITEE